MSSAQQDQPQPLDCSFPKYENNSDSTSVQFQQFFDRRTQPQLAWASDSDSTLQCGAEAAGFNNARKVNTKRNRRQMDSDHFEYEDFKPKAKPSKDRAEFLKQDFDWEGLLPGDDYKYERSPYMKEIDERLREFHRKESESNSELFGLTHESSVAEKGKKTKGHCPTCHCRPKSFSGSYSNWRTPMSVVNSYSDRTKLMSVVGSISDWTNSTDSDSGWTPRPPRNSEDIDSGWDEPAPCRPKGMEKKTSVSNFDRTALPTFALYDSKVPAWKDSGKNWRDLGSPKPGNKTITPADVLDDFETEFRKKHGLPEPAPPGISLPSTANSMFGSQESGFSDDKLDRTIYCLSSMLL